MTTQLQPVAAYGSREDIYIMRQTRAMVWNAAECLEFGLRAYGRTVERDKGRLYEALGACKLCVNISMPLQREAIALEGNIYLMLDKYFS